MTWKKHLFIIKPMENETDNPGNDVANALRDAIFECRDRISLEAQFMHWLKSHNPPACEARNAASAKIMSYLYWMRMQLRKQLADVMESQGLDSREAAHLGYSQNKEISEECVCSLCMPTDETEIAPAQRTEPRKEQSTVYLKHRYMWGKKEMSHWVIKQIRIAIKEGKTLSPELRAKCLSMQ